MLATKSSIPPGITLATPNIRSKVKDLGHIGSPGKVIDNPGLVFAETGNPGADTRWGMPVNIP